jgi:RNA polymerase sigma-70 factor (ECF subfamily)
MERSSRLLSRLQAGRESAAASVVGRYAERLLAVARRRLGGRILRRVEPEDVVQSTFRILFSRMRQGAYQPSGSEELWKLLVTIALNKARRQGRHHRAGRRDVARERSTPAALEETVLLAAPGPDEQASLNEELSHFLERLPERDRPIVELRLQGYSTDEIAKQTGRAERSVRRVLEHVRRRLAESAHAE